jgi:hypothetical protein
MQALKPLLFLTLFATTTLTVAGVFYSKNEAMELAFGKDAQVEVQSLFPDEQQTADIEKLAKIKLGSGMLSFYVGKQQDKIIGYAAIESITVRTKPETLLIVLTPEGELRNITTLAFHEPPEYQPPERWFEQLYKKPLDEMQFNKGVDGIAGATLSTRADLDSVRKILAIFQVMVKGKETQ